jgi:pilus assembly protein Flp/PilA
VLTLTRFMADDSGADAVEYGLVIAFIALAIVAGAEAMGTAISNKLGSVAGLVAQCPTSPTSC